MNDNITKKENADENSNNDCKICMEKLEDVFAILPCGHTGYHYNCIGKIQNKKCPICNAKITGVQQIFM